MGPEEQPGKGTRPKRGRRKGRTDCLGWKRPERKDGTYYLAEIKDPGHFLSQKKSSSINTIDV